MTATIEQLTPRCTFRWASAGRTCARLGAQRCPAHSWAGCSDDCGRCFYDGARCPLHGHPDMVAAFAARVHLTEAQERTLRAIAGGDFPDMAGGRGAPQVIAGLTARGLLRAGELTTLGKGWLRTHPVT